MNSDSTTVASEQDVKASVSPNAAKNSARSSAQSAQPRKPTKRRTYVLAVIGVIAALWLVKFGWHAYNYESTEDAFIAGHLHQVSTQVNAPVQAVLVEDNQSVTAGQTLVQLDPSEFAILVDHARGELDHARAQATQASAAMEQAQAQIAQADARAAQAEAQLAQVRAQAELAHFNQKRTEELHHENVGAVTQVDYDTANSGASAADASVHAAEANLVAARATVTSANSARDAARAEANSAQANIATAEATLRDAELKLSYTKIVAPVAGRVGNKAVEVGNRVQTGQVLMDVAAPEVWINANFKETQIAHMRVGQPVEITIDAIPGKTIHGHVDSFAPASGAQFALLPPDNATGNFNKVVQRVPVKIALDNEDAKAISD
ncbi:MAG TPA: HlyD family secretion protein, partial [Opitutaceae bacterium]